MSDMDDVFSLMGPADGEMLGPSRGSLMNFGGMGGSGSSQMVMFSGGGGGSGFMMSSVRSFDALNPSNNYERTQTAQFGPGGIMEAREQVRDGGRGIEEIGLRRQLGEQYSQLERSRHLATGEERSKRTVHNMEEDDVERFDDRWMAAAQHSLPAYSWARSGAVLSAPATRLALPEPLAQHSRVSMAPQGIPHPPRGPAAASVRSQHSVHYDPVSHQYVALLAHPASYSRSRPQYY
eukprot:GGOE01003715.1.p1 GENE.GGOE01003715.1~~GGOE01003715.1.p1  ORF type:complete len:262 (+),score=51.66 GGOE01003715.1:79-786(+)